MEQEVQVGGLFLEVVMLTNRNSKDLMSIGSEQVNELTAHRSRKSVAISTINISKQCGSIRN